MSRLQSLFSIKVSAVVLMTPLLMEGNSGGPPVRRSGAPNEQTCAAVGCHTGTGNPFNTGIEMNFGAGGATYTPGGARVTFTMTLPTASIYGFQMSARVASDAANLQAGTFTPATGQAVLCADGGERPASGCRAATPIEYLQHNDSALRSNAVTIQWTPPATNVGNVTIYVAANSANGNGQPSGDRIMVQNFTLTPAAGTSNAPAIRADRPVLQAFSGSTGISPGTWVEIYGTNLSTATREWAGTDFTGSKAPTSLEGVRVKVAGKDAFIRYVSPTQVNVQVPDDIGAGNGIQVELTNAAGSNSTTVSAAAVSPALLTTPTFNVSGRQYVAALFPDFTTFVGREGLIAGVPFRPAKPGETIIIYAVGCGATNPASPAGEIVPAARTLASPITVRFGQTAATTAQAFLAPQAIGLCQFNVTVPNVAAGDIALDATVNGVATGQTLFTTIGN
ncbi:MAG: hypothetical protein IT162_08785 [Bryobacterales bacterium]|nr:hypothetical protein [Bryobacterales bacterium]